MRVSARLFRIAWLCGALALSGGAAAQADVLEYRFMLFLGGLRAAEVSFDAAWTAERYEGRSLLRTVGLAKLLYSGFFRAEADGPMAQDNFVPMRFEADSAFEDDRQRVEMAYKDGRPQVIAADPPFRPRPYAIAPEAQTGTLDPMAAALTLIRPEPVASICNRTVDVFDGRRRIRLALGAPRESHDGLRCTGTYTRVAGFSPKIMRQGADFPFTVVFRANEAGIAEIWQIFADTDFGRAVARRES
ncbi:MAG: DUF3108 domain-containing protein [Pseudomonadota bacterium]